MNTDTESKAVAEFLKALMQTHEALNTFSKATLVRTAATGLPGMMNSSSTH